MFYNNAYNLLLRLQDVGYKLVSLDKNFPKSYHAYDPSKYIRGKFMLEAMYPQSPHIETNIVNLHQEMPSTDINRQLIINQTENQQEKVKNIPENKDLIELKDRIQPQNIERNQLEDQPNKIDTITQASVMEVLASDKSVSSQMQFNKELTGYTPENPQIEADYEGYLSEEEISQRALEKLKIKAEDVIQPEYPHKEMNRDIKIDNLQEENRNIHHKSPNKELTSTSININLEKINL